jgi:bifunctional non-homologous end joining protein LigD
MAAPDAAPRGAMNAAPHRTGIVPMMAALSALPADDDCYAFEVKWDGMRVVAHCEPGGLWLQTRTLRDITGGFPELAGLQNQLGARNAVVDGEIVAFDADGRPSFQRLQSRMHLADREQVPLAAERAPAMYMIFDLLCLDGESLMATDYRQRRRELVGLNPTGRCRRRCRALERMRSPQAATPASRESSPNASTPATGPGIAAASGSRSRTSCDRNS